MPGVSRTNTTPQPIHPAVQVLREHGAADIDAFVQSNVHIVNDKGQDVLLKYRHGQQVMARIRRKQMAKRGFARIFDLKSRQIGITTQVQNQNGAIALCRDNISVATVAHLEDRAIDILQKAKYAYSKLPKLLQLTLSRDAKAGLAYADTGSNQVIVSAKNIEAVRSGTKQHVHLSEWALYANPEHSLYEVSQVCHLVDGTSIIIETTGRREGSYAHWFWRRCKAGKEIFEAVFMPWQEDPECDLKFINDKHRDAVLAEAYAYEPMLKERAQIFKLTPGNIAWAYNVLKNKAFGNWERFLEDYPCSDEECWRSKGDIFFGANNITRLEQLNKDVTYDAYRLSYEDLEKTFTNPQVDLQRLASFDPIQDSFPNLMIFQPPRPGHQYVVPADSGEGTAGGDPSNVQVIDMHTGEQMAEFSGVVQPHQNANVIASLATWYNMALAVPELNNQGLTTLNELVRIYRHIYVWRPFDDSKFKPGSKYGWVTGEKSRAIMLSLARRVVEEVAKGHTSTHGMIRSPRLVNEMRSFKEHPDTGKPEAAAGCHDDSVMTFAIGWIVAQQETKNMTDDIILRLRMGDVQQEAQSLSSIIIPKFDVHQTIDIVKQQLQQQAGLRMEDIFDVTPWSESPQGSRPPVFRE